MDSKNTRLASAKKFTEHKTPTTTITISSIEELIKHRGIMKQDLCRDMGMNHMTLRDRINNPMGMDRLESDSLAKLLNIPSGLMEHLIRGGEIELEDPVTTP